MTNLKILSQNISSLNTRNKGGSSFSSLPQVLSHHKAKGKRNDNRCAVCSCWHSHAHTKLLVICFMATELWPSLFNVCFTETKLKESPGGSVCHYCPSCRHSHSQLSSLLSPQMSLLCFIHPHVSSTVVAWIVVYFTFSFWSKNWIGLYLFLVRINRDRYMYDLLSQIQNMRIDIQDIERTLLIQ